jgi:hypothetical protein
VPQAVLLMHALPTFPAVHSPAQYADTQVAGVHSASTSHTFGATPTANPEHTALRRHGRASPAALITLTEVCVTISAEPAGPDP